MTNSWLDTVAAFPGLFGKTMRDAGWPEAMTPGELAALMRPPIERGDLHGIAIHRSRENFIAAQCAAGVIEHATKIEAQKALILITAPVFAAWLLVQGEAPSIHIQAWFDAVGAAGAKDQVAPVKPLQRSAAQDNAILCELKKQGYKPLALPRNPPGKPGVKAAIRAAIDGKGIFAGSTVFNKSWDRLRDAGEIADQD